MDLSDLEIFVGVAEALSFTGAARQLHMTQPSISSRMAALESEVGQPLFTRHGRGVRLTEAGLTLLPYAKRALQAVQEGIQAVEDLKHLRRGRLAIGSAHTISTYALPRILGRFQKRHPGVEVTVRTGNSEDVIEMLMSDEVEVGLIRATFNHSALEIVPFFHDTVILVAHPDHPLAGIDPVPPDLLAGESFILYEQGSDFRAILDAALAQASLEPRVSMELDSVEATKRMVESGLGIAPVHRVAVQEELQAGVLVELKTQGIRMPSRKMAYVHRRGPLGPLGQAFVEEIRAAYGLG